MIVTADVSSTIVFSLSLQRWRSDTWAIALQLLKALLAMHGLEAHGGFAGTMKRGSADLDRPVLIARNHSPNFPIGKRCLLVKRASRATKWGASVSGTASASSFRKYISEAVRNTGVLPKSELVHTLHRTCVALSTADERAIWHNQIQPS